MTRMHETVAKTHSKLFKTQHAAVTVKGPCKPLPCQMIHCQTLHGWSQNYTEGIIIQTVEDDDWRIQPTHDMKHAISKCFNQLGKQQVNKQNAK